jgi:hypothetical protein
MMENKVLHKRVLSLFIMILLSTLVKGQTAQPLTFEEYIKSAVPSKTELDVFLKKPGVWSKYDTDLGYVLGNSLPLEGIDTSCTISTTQADGARTMFMYKDKPCRINTYGDSFTQCQQVSDGETWQEYLAAHLGEPVRNYGVGGYGVYQSYLRLLREEKGPNSAKYLVFYLWGGDHTRSLLRCRYIATKDWNSRNEPGMKFHGNFWPNIEMDLNTGQFIENKNPLNTPELLYKMTNPEWMYQNLKDDIALQLLLFRNKKITDLNFEKAELLSRCLKMNIDFKDTTNLENSVIHLLDRYSFAASEYILRKLKIFVERNGKKLLVVLFDPYRVTNSLIEKGTRYDEEIIDFLQQENFSYFDMNLIHVSDYKRYNLSLDDYYKIYFLGHYNPTGNHFFAFSIRKKIVDWLDPKPITYDKSDKKWVDFKGYLQGVK